MYRSIYELNENEFDELRYALYCSFVDNDIDIINDVDDWHDIPDSIVINHYDSISFVDDDFWCNQ